MGKPMNDLFLLLYSTGERINLKTVVFCKKMGYNGENIVNKGIQGKTEDRDEM